MESLCSSSSLNPLFTNPPSLSAHSALRPRPSLSFASSRSHGPKPRLGLVFCAAETMSVSKEAKLWGGRFEESVTDAVERFTESISFDKQLYKQDIMGSKAHATMLAAQGLMSTSDRDSILQGLDVIEKKIEDSEFVWRTDREDVHMNIEAALTDLIGEPAKKLHTARSRNDQVLTDFRLWCREAIDNILVRVEYLQVALVKLALEYEGLIVPGYTHLQRAQPVLLQHLLLAFVEQLDRDAARLQDCRVRMNFCPLGACALAGTGLPIDRFMTSKELGFTAPMRNSIDAVSDRDFVLEFLSANSIIAIHLSRLGEEWVLWASEEFGFITPSDAVSTGSSIMPQKKNPDPMELVRGKSARVVGDLVTLLTLCKGLPLAYNRDLQILKQNSGCGHERFIQEHLQSKSGNSVWARLKSKDMSASKDKKSNQNQGKKSMEAGASNNLSDAADVYYGRGVRITRAMKADIEAKSPCKNVSAQLGAKKITSLNNGLPVRSSPRRKLGTTERDGQQKKQKAATPAGEQTRGMESKKKEVQKKEPKRTTGEKNNKAPKKHKPSPSSYEPSARQLRVLRSLGLAAPLGSPFQK